MVYDANQRIRKLEDELARARSLNETMGANFTVALLAAGRLARALRLTQEFVGDEALPALEGWEWFDALSAYGHFERYDIDRSLTEPPMVLDSTWWSKDPSHTFEVQIVDFRRDGRVIFVRTKVPRGMVTYGEEVTVTAEQLRHAYEPKPIEVTDASSSA